MANINSNLVTQKATTFKKISSCLLNIFPLENSFVNFKIKLHVLMPGRRCLNSNWFSITSTLFIFLWM